ncbi:hypothetical protein KM043_014462 [Ampulex compressa]|nr:hypothetical protein KM043_014462 [Ampulex compressa]
MRNGQWKEQEVGWWGGSKITALRSLISKQDTVIGHNVEGRRDKERTHIIRIEEFAKEISEMEGRCIDIGCGPGNVTKLLILPKLPPQTVLVGADISKPMIDRAKLKCRDEKRLSFIQLDIGMTNLPPEEVGRYDNALSFYCLHWVRNSRQAFKNIYKLLQPGGKAVIMLISSHDCYDAYIRMYENPQYRPYMEDVHLFVSPFHQCNNSRAELRKILEDVGFEVQHCSRRDRIFVFQNAEVFRNHMFAVNPFISRIPERLKSEYMDVLVQEMIRGKIAFPKDSDSDRRILDRYYNLVAYIKKPTAVN